eukprot:EC788438.1.p2 GENE.EC788438.1~~EC788438.1.p2  ORF type:complete len:95 (+),score=24.17 EC788438.1:114-398(+)
MSGDEKLSDSYGEEVDGPFLKAKGGYIMKDTGVAGFECGEEGVEDGVVRAINIVDAFKLQEVPFDKKQYQAHIKGLPAGTEGQAGGRWPAGGCC